MKSVNIITCCIFVSLSLAGLAFSHCGNCEMDDSQHATSSETTRMNPLIHSYLSIQEALAADDLSAAQIAASGVDFHAESDDTPLIAAVRSISDANDIEAARVGFEKFSAIVIAQLVSSSELSESLYLAHCPMAFGNKGASWVQSGKTITNPYFGSKMLHCGTLKPIK